MIEAKLLTTPEVAERLGVTTRRVQALIKSGRLPSQQFGRDHLINETDLALVADRKPGRPPKPKAEATGAAEGQSLSSPMAESNEPKPMKAKSARKAKAGPTPATKPAKPKRAGKSAAKKSAR